MTLKRTISFLFFLSFSLFSFSEDKPVVLKRELNKKSILIGESLIYTLSIKAPSHIQIEFPQLKDLGDFEVRDFSLKEKVFKDKIYRGIYTLTAYSWGEKTIGSLRIGYNDGDRQNYIEVPELRVRVKSFLKGPENDIYDIRPPKEVGIPLWIDLSFILGILSLAILGFIFLSRKNKKSKRDSSPKIYAHSIALNALEELAKKNYLAQGEFKLYYLELSSIVRHYLEARFKLAAAEMTTEEFLNKVKDESILSSEQKLLLQNFLESADLVKFAKYRPSPEGAGEALNLARRLILETKGEDLTN